MSREIMQQALEALKKAKIVMGNLTSDDCSDCMYIPVTTSIAALEAALAQPEREWVGLTQEERNRYISYTAENFAAGVLWAETKLRERNT